LRAILRQDPDVILVGEIRDHETGVIAAEAALTGHLLMSTLHTNDAASAVMRLCEMGVPRFLVAAVINAVVAQRLMRRVCAHCATEYIPTADELRSLGRGLDALAAEPSLRFMRGAGCGRCEGTGYRGRVPILELLTFDAAMRDAIVAGIATPELHAMAVAAGMADLRTAALTRLFAGETTTSEVMRVCAAAPGGA
jgi:type II secretory ATPase GspE/PulE/Tfp pilus assembly ATPase PilB-like protein